MTKQLYPYPPTCERAGCNSDDVTYRYDIDIEDTTITEEGYYCDQCYQAAVDAAHDLHYDQHVDCGDECPVCSDHYEQAAYYDLQNALDALTMFVDDEEE